MDNVPKKVKKTRSKISVKTYKRPMIFIILTMLFINLGILFVAAFIAVLIDPDYTSWIDAFANGSLKWMLTPNSLLSIKRPQTLFLAVLILITGLVLFSGTIIALTTQTIKEYFNKKRSGSGRILLEDHIVILNWNNKVPELVADLLHVEFDLTVMILADINKQEAEDQIVNALKKKQSSKDVMKRLNVLIKNGDPMLITDLIDVSIPMAKAIVVVNKDMAEYATKALSKSDLNVIKTVMNLGRITFEHQPHIVVEVKQKEAIEKVNTLKDIVTSLHDFKITPICFDRRLGQVIAQTIIANDMEDVYLSLFSYKDSEVYYLKDISFEECLLTRSNVIPLSHHKTGLFVLAETKRCLEEKTITPPELIPLNIINKQLELDMDVYFLGMNNKLEFSLHSLLEFIKLYHVSLDVKTIKDEQLPDLIQEMNQTNRESVIVMLSEEGVDQDSLDANVIDQLICFEKELHNEKVNIIVELLDPKNDLLIKDFHIGKSIISNKLVSLLMSKLALQPETATFYENLLTLEINPDFDDHEITIRRAEEIIELNSSITFERIIDFVYSLYHASGKKLIPFGLIRNHELRIFSRNLHNQDLEVQKDDFLVLMKI